LSPEDTDTQPSNSKFQPCQLVKIKVPREGEELGTPAPMLGARGKTGVVEMEGKVWVTEQNNEARFEQAYFVRIDRIGPVLVGEGWIEDT